MNNNIEMIVPIPLKKIAHIYTAKNAILIFLTTSRIRL